MLKQKHVTIIDYGVGNLHSIVKAVGNFTEKVFVSEDPQAIESADAIILPGVGSFQSGMEGVNVRNLVPSVKKYAATGKPMLGICLGAQIMLGKGFEFGEFDGLNIIHGKVIKFPVLENNEKIPHVGWNSIYPNADKIWNDSILKNLDPLSSVYFVHSYILVPENNKNIFAKTKYGGYEFCSVIRSGNIYGCQFHPEKSGKIGLEIIKNFLELI